MLDVTGPLPFPQKAGLMGCIVPPFISSGLFHLLSDVGLFVITVTFSPVQSCDALVTDAPLCLPHLLGRLARHQIRVCVGSDTTCHGSITLSQKLV